MLINRGLGAGVSGGFYFMGVPNVALWGILQAELNFVPPAWAPSPKVMVLGPVGLLAVGALSNGLPPPAWYLLLFVSELLPR
jgi:predicted PurR-regulated permease PerM